MLKTSNQIGFDRFDLKQWEIILDDLEGNVDRELGIEIKREVKNVVKATLDLSNTLIKIDEDKKKIQLFTKKGELIGEMYSGIYWIGEENFNHNGIEIEKKFRGKGYGKLLFENYKETFGVLDIEYTRKKDNLQFLLSMGYIAFSLIDENTGDEEDIAHLNKDEIIKILKKGYTIKLVL